MKKNPFKAVIFDLDGVVTKTALVHAKAWKQAFDEIEIDPDFYAHRQRPTDEVFPWDIIHTGVQKKFLLKEYQRSQEGTTRVDCRERCHGCGILVDYVDEWSTEWCCPSPV